MAYPEFVQGDTLKSFVVTVRDEDGNPIDVSAGEVRLFPLGLDSGDKPGGSEGILGTFPDSGTDGRVEFQALGSVCEIGDGRQAQLYMFQVEYTDANDKVTRTPPKSHFLVWRTP